MKCVLRDMVARDTTSGAGKILALVALVVGPFPNLDCIAFPFLVAAKNAIPLLNSTYIRSAHLDLPCFWLSLHSRR
ncbi:MAG: hypothetical protein CM15mP88_0680 [Pseudomonadota bacterium]|nr:MAG: hypothetical protein CM15mP88_0680 [Pseudomonadota bacterium]